jgi:uncharacterized damage-inducible protein DinB
MNEPLANMFHYNAWANDALLAACRDLTHEQLQYQGAGATGTVQQLLLHVVGGQQTFVLRTEGRQHEGELHRWSEWPGIEHVVEISRESSAALVRIAEALHEDVDVVLPWQGQRPVFPRSFFLVHAMSHGADHRSELKVSLSQLDIETPDLDAWNWAGAQGYGREAS